MDRERYYVQVARPFDSLLRVAFGGWLTQNVWLDSKTAEHDADTSAETGTIARVISATELLEEEGSQALAAAEASTQMQLQVRLTEHED